MTNSITKYSAMFLAVILVAGTLSTFFPSFMVGTAQAQLYNGGMDRDRDSDRKQVSVSFLKCNNVNVNVNGLELSVLPSFLSDDEIAAEAQDANTDANLFANNGGSNSGSTINDFRFICINNNNNTFVGEPISPGPTTANLNVTKSVTCQQEDRNSLVPSIQQLSLNCEDLLNIITEDQFNITVTDTNVSPSNFNGSKTGTLVSLNAGPFTVKEEPYDSVAADVATIEDIQTNVSGPFPSFSGDCTQTGTGSFSATGDIAAGGQETCNIENHFVIEKDTACDACFARLDTNTQNAINDLLETIPDGGITLSAARITIPVEVNSTQKLCEFFNSIPTITVTSAQRVALVNEFAHSSISQIPAADAIIDCLEEVGKIIVRDFPPV